jgi:polysaccharide pyruvyl transferase WcaK-like protein
MSFAKFGNAARKLGIPYILWGASVGPFTNHPQAERALNQHLKRITLITARENDTVEYLKRLGIGNLVEPCADPAYVVASEIQAPPRRQEGALTIGINLSPLSSVYSHFSMKEAIHKQALTIEHIVRSTKARILLQPHVICGWNEGDDDLRYLRKIKNAISHEYTSYVQLFEEDHGFVGAKRELAKCDMVIAARMHCAINALSSQVPTILVSYSNKSVGMADYIYGHRDWLVSVNDFNNTELVLSKVHGMITQNDRIRSHLADRISVVRKDAYAPCARLKHVLATAGTEISNQML